MEFSALKAMLSQVFDRIKAKTDEGLLPEEADVGQFSRLCTQMHMQAEEAWLGEAEDFAHMATRLLIAVKKGRTEESIMLIESLDDAQSFCHRTYKA